MNKRHTANLAKVDQDTVYATADAFAIVDTLTSAKFDETVEVAVRLGVDARKSDQMVRGSVGLPNGLGKNIRVVVLAKGPKADEATAAGAEAVGADDLIERIQKGWLDFDKVIATPDMMASVSKVARVLGPRGLMPNPKTGTVTMDVTKAITEVKAGKVDYRIDKTSIVHAPIGKKSFGKEKLEENYRALIDSIVKAKPSAAKGQYVRGVTVSTTMGPGIRVDVSELIR